MLEGIGKTTPNHVNDVAEGFTGSPTWVPGKFGPCLYLNGTTDTINLTDIPPAATSHPLTVALWVRPTSTARQDYIGRWGSSIQRQFVLLSGTTAGKFQFFTSSNGSATSTTGAGTTTLTPGTWYHIAGTHDGTTMRLYVNGALEASFTSGLGIFTGSTYPFYVGRSNDAYAGAAVDDVRIYNRALTADDIREVYNSPFVAFEPSLSRRVPIAMFAPPPPYTPAGRFHVPISSPFSCIL